MKSRNISGALKVTVFMATGIYLTVLKLLATKQSLLFQEFSTSFQRPSWTDCANEDKDMITSRATSRSPTGTSACLYVMDDNHYLIEWLAYHFHTVNLRHVIVTNDPGSLTSPMPVFDRWKDLMDIQVWTDEDFIPHDFEQDLYRRIHGSDGREKRDPQLQNYLSRQNSFNLQCLKEHKRRNHGWTMVIDTDEYLTYNPELSKIKKAGSDQSAWNVPPIEARGSVATILDQMTIPNLYYDDVTTPCIPVFRRQFAALESPDSMIDAMSPPNFDGRYFQTIRWRRYGANEATYTTRTGEKCPIDDRVPSKVVIDLGRLRLQDLDHPDNDGNPHRPLETICSHSIYIPEEDTPLIAHHYMGTREQWLYREADNRGTCRNWKHFPGRLRRNIDG